MKTLPLFYSYIVVCAFIGQFMAGISMLQLNSYYHIYI